MPIPFLVTGLAIGCAAAVGLGAKKDAQETNEIAQNYADKAQKIYNDAKQSLEKAQIQTENSLLKLGNSKKRVLETSINQFLLAYERIKNIELSESIGLNEIKKFKLESQDAIQLREMSDIYESAFSSGVAGAATGAVIALAASGSLPIASGVLSTAGGAFFAGEVGAAAGIASSALSFGAAFTPLAAIAAPAMLFSGLNSKMKADENFEKAYTMYSEAKVAVEKMKTSETLCMAISKRADMFNNLLNELNVLFSQCTGLLDSVTRKKTGLFKNKTIDVRTLSKDEMELLYVTRSLAGAVKAVIDTPILTKNGNVSAKSLTVYNETKKELPQISSNVQTINSYDFKVKPSVIVPKKQNPYNDANSKETVSSQSTVRNLIAIIAGWFAYSYIHNMALDSYSFSIIAFTAIVLLIMNNETTSKIFKLVKNLCCIALGSGFCLLFFDKCSDIMNMEHYIIYNIITCIVSLIVTAVCIPERGKSTNSIKRTLLRIFSCILFFALAILIFAFLNKVLGVPYNFTMAITIIIYFVLAIISSFIAD